MKFAEVGPIMAQPSLCQQVEAALAKGSPTRAACVKQLEAMRDGDRAPDVRGAAGRALAPFGA